MPRGTPHDLTGLLLANGHYPVLRVDDGGEWRLEVGARYRHLLGLRLCVLGKRSGFDMIEVERIETIEERCGMKVTITDFYPDATASLSYPGEIVFRDGGVVLSFIDDQSRHIVYTGKEEASGHWAVACPVVRGRGTLHRSPVRPLTLEGSYTFDGYQGMWTIDIEDDEED